MFLIFISLKSDIHFFPLQKVMEPLVEIKKNIEVRFWRRSVGNQLEVPVKETAGK